VHARMEKGFCLLGWLCSGVYFFLHEMGNSYSHASVVFNTEHTSRVNNGTAERPTSSYKHE